MTEQSYPFWFWTYVSREKLAQAISAVQGPFLKLFETTWQKDSFLQTTLLKFI